MEKGTVNVNDVILTDGGQIGVVTELKSGKYPVVYKVKKGPRGFHCAYHSVVSVIGKATPEGVAEILKEEPIEVSDWVLPENLKGAKSGETKLKLINGDEVVFIDYKPRRPKYPVVYEKGGKRYKTAESQVVSVIA
jgi:hypothetical protein